VRRLPLVLPFAAAAVLAAQPARPARSDTAGPQARARQVLAQVAGLDQQIEQVAEAYDLAGVDLTRTRQSLRTNARELRVAHHNLSRAQDALARLLVAKYEDDAAGSTLTVVLGATSLNDLIDRLDATQLIAKQDASVIAQVRSFRARALAARVRLRQEQADKRALRQSLGQRRAEIQGRLAERRQLLSSIQAKVSRLQARERVRQEGLRREAEARLAAEPTSRSEPSGSAADPPPTSPPPVESESNATTSPLPSSAPAPTRHAHVVPILMRYLGTPYQWGGASPADGFDCSGLVLYVYAQVGVSLPHNAALQYGFGVPVDRDELEPGDIVFFNNLGHDGVYIGGGEFIDAPKTGDVVKIENLNDPRWSASYVGARRLP
jgi:peptidoglycan DL-endopeptidase CwlO